MALWHLFFIYRKSENNALESLMFHSEYASKSYQDPNTGNLMNKQGSFWMILSKALAASPEVILEAMCFPQFFEVRTICPPYLSWFICKMEGWSSTHARAEDRECNPHDSMSWSLQRLPHKWHQPEQPLFCQEPAPYTGGLHPCVHCRPPSSVPSPLGRNNHHFILDVSCGEIESTAWGWPSRTGSQWGAAWSFWWVLLD